MLIQFKLMIVSIFMAASASQPAINIESINEGACLSHAIYKEASNQPMSGKLAVAHVILNRTKDSRYPSNICGVISQKGQFSFYGKKENKINENDLKVVKQMDDSIKAAYMVMNEESEDNTKGAIAFVNVKIATDTNWLHGMKKTVDIGEHSFYRHKNT